MPKVTHMLMQAGEAQMQGALRESAVLRCMVLDALAVKKT